MEEDQIRNRIRELNMPSIGLDQMKWLNQPFSTYEIKAPAFQLEPLKASGIDGKPGMFYQKYWHIVGELTTTSLNFLNFGFLQKELNKTIITLIPKVECPEKIFQFRPINLCNMAHKIIFKVLVNRLRPIMDSLITFFESAFVKGKLISNNSILRGEIFNIIRKRKKGKGVLGALKVALDNINNGVYYYCKFPSVG